ncbi:replication-associated recombination protein A [Marinicella gelatinilytica]|uniref:replication-associated recombination protein A n=1 Tax=Marinicella gelatinilytica TaxID=2996017 RepID=UPI002260E204|nr:replication-associated recombination protein A [Marinicella gelatinilytica]MCX7544661.1 replication-associated recombination protein A [Marinicella gelatinilytica]
MVVVKHQPLADKLRPTTLDEVVGQQHLVAANKPLHRLLANNSLHSMVFWGPPGTGKTTLAQIIADSLDANFIQISAVLSGVKDIRGAIEQAQVNLPNITVLFVDEIHRFNKSQQDAFLPHLESGLITLIGATTENPSFALNNALLSRLKVYILKSLDDDSGGQLLDKGVQSFDPPMVLTEDQQQALIAAADGDGRKLLNLVEILQDYSSGGLVKDEDVALVTTGQTRRFDRQGDVFYDQISALHKSVRSSNPDAALYWLARMLDGGCDPLYVARRVLRMASEDIGNADPRAFSICLTAWQTYERLGSPEGELALAQAVAYLASCAKSNAIYVAFKAARQDVKKYGSLEVPMHLRNAPTQLMKDNDFGKGYQYDHDYEGGIAYSQTGFPDKIGEQVYYHPADRGLERQIAEKLKHIRQQRS